MCFGKNIQNSTRLWVFYISLSILMLLLKVKAGWLLKRPPWLGQAQHGTFGVFFLVWSVRRFPRAALYSHKDKTKLVTPRTAQRCEQACTFVSVWQSPNFPASDGSRESQDGNFNWRMWVMELTRTRGDEFSSSVEWSKKNLAGCCGTAANRQYA